MGGQRWLRVRENRGTQLGFRLLGYAISLPSPGPHRPTPLSRHFDVGCAVRLDDAGGEELRARYRGAPGSVAVVPANRVVRRPSHNNNGKRPACVSLP